MITRFRLHFDKDTRTYPQDDDYSIVLSLEENSYTNIFNIRSIVIHRKLKDSNVLPSHGSPHARGKPESVSLQINYDNIWCNNLKRTQDNPKIEHGDNLTLDLTNLRDVKEGYYGVNELRIDECTLKIRKKTYGLNDLEFSNNRITKATCTGGYYSGGGRRKYRATKKARKNNRRYSRRKQRCVSSNE
jgi:hypothetical protein